MQKKNKRKRKIKEKKINKMAEFTASRKPFQKLKSKKLGISVLFLLRLFIFFFSFTFNGENITSFYFCNFKIKRCKDFFFNFRRGNHIVV